MGKSIPELFIFHVFVLPIFFCGHLITFSLETRNTQMVIVHSLFAHLMIMCHHLLSKRKMELARS